MLVFGGTTEGREAAAAISAGHRVTVSVAGGYGAELAAGGAAEIRSGRLDAEGIARLLKEGAFGAAIDATHPYADKAHAEILAACRLSGVPLVRLSRSCGAEIPEGVRAFGSMAELSRAAAETRGNVFVATGTKELSELVAGVGAGRLFVRVLPSAESISACRSLGIPSSRIIAMQGPFSRRLNEAMFVETGARVLVTKLSGRNGGQDEKISAAAACSMSVLALARPPEGGAAIVRTAAEAAAWADSLPAR